jgi:PAS domain S-box-containing protein
MTATGEVELVNRQMLDYFGARSEELKNWSSFLHEDDRARVIVEWTRTIETTEPYQIEHRLRRADGVYRWFQARGLALRDGEGRVTGWYNLLTDIDDGKRAVEVLRTSEQNLRLIVDSIPGFVITATPSGELELANLRMLTYFGKTLEELKEWSLVIHPDDRPLVVAAWAHSVQTGDPHDIPQRLLGADGIYRWFHVRASALRNAEGKIQRWYALFTDMTNRSKPKRSCAAVNGICSKPNASVIREAGASTLRQGSSPARLKWVACSALRTAMIHHSLTSGSTEFTQRIGHAFVNSSNSALLRNASIRPIIAFSFQTAPSGTNIHAGIRS